jgi:short-subunit dehydrogenase involved in D-alanine esterification of teichoic acids
MARFAGETILIAGAGSGIGHRLMNEARARFGTLDGAFANAGAGIVGYFADCLA